MPKKQPLPQPLRRALRLQHHRHTGKLLHHRHTSYRGIALLLIVAGISMIGINILARSTANALYQVYARVPAAMPTQAPVITSPEDGAILHKSSIIVEGTCPDITPRVIINMAVDGSSAGSSPCDDSNHFSVPIVVSAGTHSLIAQVYTITNDHGPDSQSINVVYVAPVGSGQTAQPGQDDYTKTEPVSLTAADPFIVFGPSTDAVWHGTITGGSLPYRVTIDWGDGATDTYTIEHSGEQTFRHHYSQMTPHTIQVRITDTDDRGAAQNYAAVTPYVAPALTAPSSTEPTSTPFQGSVPLGIYGAYLLVVSGAGTLWYFMHPAFAYAPVPKPSARVYYVRATRKTPRRSIH